MQQVTFKVFTSTIQKYSATVDHIQQQGDKRTYRYVDQKNNALLGVGVVQVIDGREVKTFFLNS